jgi:HK97 family phage major capsid protein
VRDEAAANFLRTAKVGDKASFTLPLETRAAVMRTNTGAAAVPATTFDQIVADQINLGGLVAAGLRVWNTTSGEPMTVPTTLARPTAATVAEGGVYSKSDGTLAPVVLGAYKYGIISQASYELVTDSTADVVSYVAEIGGQAIDLALENDVLLGNGTSACNGILRALASATVGRTLAAAGTQSPLTSCSTSCSPWASSTATVLCSSWAIPRSRWQP